MNMSILNFDARSVSPQVSIEVIPEGWYKCIVQKSNIKPTKAGDGGLLELILQIIEGQYQGRTLYWNLNLFNPNQQACEIAYRQLSSLCHVIGQFNVQDTNTPDNMAPALHNIPFMAHAVIAQGNQGSINNVKGVRDINGNDPGKQGQGPAMAAPAQGQIYTPPPSAGGPAPGSWGPQQQPNPNPSQAAPAAAGQAPAAWQPPGQGAPNPAPAPAAGAPQPSWSPQAQGQAQPSPAPNPGQWQGQGGAPANAPWNKQT
jgi:Protein of unknown function (DUF669)